MNSTRCDEIVLFREHSEDWENTLSSFFENVQFRELLRFEGVKQQEFDSARKAFLPAKVVYAATSKRALLFSNERFEKKRNHHSETNIFFFFSFILSKN